MSDSRNNGTETGKVGRGKPPPEHQFKPGNPGRPKGARNKLGEAFLEALHDDFAEHGKQAIIDTRTDKPDQYLRVIAATLPKELNVKVSELDELSDDQLARQLAAGLAALASAGVDLGAGTGQAPPPQPPGDVPTIQ